MSTLSVAMKSIPVAVTGWLISANASAIGGLTERRDAPAAEVYSQILKDEGLEDLWEFFSSSVLTNTIKEAGISIPEQIVMVPGKLLGSIWHWAISSKGSINRKSVAENEVEANDTESFFNNFHKNILDPVTQKTFDLIGLNPESPNLAKFALTQIAGVSAAGYLLSRSDDENLPGINIDNSMSSGRNLLEGLGYMVAEQTKYLLSQTARFYIDYKDTFDKNRLAKSLANVVNEKLIPGHALSALSGSLSSLLFSDYIPKTTATALGEMPMSILNRVANAHRRRATKKALGANDKPEANHIVGEKITKAMDSIFNPIRKLLLYGVETAFNITPDEINDSLQISDEKVQIRATRSPEAALTAG